MTLTKRETQLADLCERLLSTLLASEVMANTKDPALSSAVLQVLGEYEKYTNRKWKDFLKNNPKYH